MSRLGSEDSWESYWEVDKTTVEHWWDAAWFYAESQMILHSETDTWKIFRKRE